MRHARPVRHRRTPFALGLVAALAACATIPKQRRVILIEPARVIPATALPPLAGGKFERLAGIDPARPLGDPAAAQTLSLFGREDLIAAVNGDYKATECTPLAPAVNVLDEITRRARATSIVIINESHERSEHRGFIAQVAQRLRPLGYATLAMETLQHNPSTTPQRFAPPFLQQPALPYLSDDDGFYLFEAAFGRLGRQAKALGYRLVPYEANDYGTLPPDATRAQRIAVREEAQASNLAAFLRANPGGKLLVHVGYSHATEIALPDGTRWMAARLKAKTGIDPLTISQTSCRGGGETMRLADLPVDQPPGTFDMIVDHPAARFDRGRPAWRQQSGDHPTSIPKALHSTAGWRVVEARLPGEPATSVPMDRVAIRPGEDIALMLPPGRYDLRVIDIAARAPR